MSRRKPIRNLKVDPRLGGQGEFVHCLPAGIEPELQPEDLTIAGYAIGAMWGDLFEARLKTEWRGWGLTAEADVGDEVSPRGTRRASADAPTAPAVP